MQPVSPLLFPFGITFILADTPFAKFTVLFESSEQQLQQHELLLQLLLQLLLRLQLQLSL